MRRGPARDGGQAAYDLPMESAEPAGKLLVVREPVGNRLRHRLALERFSLALHTPKSPDIILCFVLARFWEGEAPSEPALFGGRVFESSEHRV